MRKKCALIEKWNFRSKHEIDFQPIDGRTGDKVNDIKYIENFAYKLELLKSMNAAKRSRYQSMCEIISPLNCEHKLLQSINK